MCGLVTYRLLYSVRTGRIIQKLEKIQYRTVHTRYLSLAFFRKFKNIQQYIAIEKILKKASSSSSTMVGYTHVRSVRTNQFSAQGMASADPNLLPRRIVKETQRLLSEPGKMPKSIIISSSLLVTSLPSSQHLESMQLPTRTTLGISM